MGYCVTMELENVKFETEKINDVVKVLKELNKVWHEKFDWCRFDPDLGDIVEIIEDIGFEEKIIEGFVCINYFEREKLGDHENMFIKLAPYLEDCQIKIY